MPGIDCGILSCARRKIVVISVVVAPKWWSCVELWERFKDGCRHGLVIQDSQQLFSEDIRNFGWTFRCYELSTDQPTKMKSDKIQTAWRQTNEYMGHWYATH